MATSGRAKNGAGGRTRCLRNIGRQRAKGHHALLPGGRPDHARLSGHAGRVPPPLRADRERQRRRVDREPQHLRADHGAPGL